MSPDSRPTRVKICGSTHEHDVSAAVDAGADAVGVIADVPVDTPREVDAERARELLAAVPPLVTGVLVTMSETPDDAIDLVDTVEPDAVQLHGDLSPEAAATVADTVSASTIKAVDADEPERCLAYDDAVDALLVDSVDAEGGGGTGDTHDWERTREAVTDAESPVILAGGLTPENVAEAVETVSPFGVDVASGVERERSESDARQGVERTDEVERSERNADGRKDADAVARFVANATGRPEVLAR
ncbi:phosphoribosylanthranilate isomerase [Natronoarchaeum philippinense]|uniref:N-(5'-phosphoribosyl)anthranilate isomerase n=1 Tax=Natronoarchaeum philippinense TaxID=558529 RepID=A0A285P7S6_NATPI|nr:phosphoribosylanthranilate isomerase [Natronoarchaeum philippinense]SNZ17263.1 phosphoribosylanthranilate isomerase [Natronoarchaeum philippinense]